MKLKIVKKADSIDGQKIFRQVNDVLKLVIDNKVYMDVAELEGLEQKFLKAAKLMHNQAAYYKNH